MSARKVFVFKVGVIDSYVMFKQYGCPPKGIRGEFTSQDGMHLRYGPHWVSGMHGVNQLYLASGVFAKTYDLVYWKANSPEEAKEVAAKAAVAIDELNIHLFGVTSKKEPELICLV